MSHQKSSELTDSSVNISNKDDAKRVTRRVRRLTRTQGRVPHPAQDAPHPDQGRGPHRTRGAWLAGPRGAQPHPDPGPKSKHFKQLTFFATLDVPNNALLFHTEVRWLSRGKVLKHVFELRDELKCFFNQKARPQFEALFSDKSELQKIAYLVDIFAILNELNLSLQGPNATCLDLCEKIQSLQMKLQLWQKKKKMDENKIYMLPTLSYFFEEHDIEPDKRITMIISVKEHLHMLADEISSYFPNLPDTPFALARSPFTVKVEDVPETVQEEFIELINSDAARTDFSTMPVTKFWIKCLQSYPVLSETVLRLLLPFLTTYLCETRFSSLLVIKSKYRSILVVEDDLLCALAKTAPRISDR
ncbi:hypothetical protein QTO34_000512, partial [Cnephaeus nilssonii]